LKSKHSQALAASSSLSNHHRAVQSWLFKNSPPKNFPVILDLTELAPDGSPHYTPPERTHLERILKILKEHGLDVLGATVTNAQQHQGLEDICAQFGLPFLMSIRNTSSTSSTTIPTALKPTAAHEPKTKPPQNPIQPTKNNVKVYKGNIRSGQQIYSEEHDHLIVLGSVHSGGEVLADGDIHIYGKCKGRALAGLTFPSSRIFAHTFDPELVCIHRTFRTMGDEEWMEFRGKAVMVSLDEDGGLVLECLPLG